MLGRKVDLRGLGGMRGRALLLRCFAGRAFVLCGLFLQMCMFVLSLSSNQGHRSMYLGTVSPSWLLVRGSDFVSSLGSEGPAMGGEVIRWWVQVQRLVEEQAFLIALLPRRRLRLLLQRSCPAVAFFRFSCITTIISTDSQFQPQNPNSNIARN